jgi:hypothetical protein
MTRAEAGRSDPAIGISWARQQVASAAIMILRMGHSGWDCYA